MPDSNALARIAAARAYLGPLGPANLDDLLGQQLGDLAPTIVFLTADRKRRISAVRGPFSPSVGGHVIELIWLDGYVAADNQARDAIVELLWLPSVGDCAGIRQGAMVNGKLTF